MAIVKVKKDGIWTETISVISDADTLDGKHADAFALATELNELQNLVGEKSVADQVFTLEQKVSQVLNNYYTKNDIENKNFASETYVDEAIASIPTPDVSGQINTHNTSTDAHSDIRNAISQKADVEHNHDDLYHTKEWINDNYYTISEIDNVIIATQEILESKANKSYIDEQIADKLSYNEQTLTEEQKVQVRENIGAMSAGELDNLATKSDVINNNYIIFNAYSNDGINYTGTIQNLTELKSGQILIMFPQKISNSKHDIKLNINELGAKNVYRRNSDGKSLTYGLTNDWLSPGRYYIIMYNNSYFEMINMQKPVAADLSGTVPISKGGTGATTAAEARVSLGITPENIGALPSDTVIPSIEGLASESYVDSAIAAIPTPDVSGQIDSHNTSTSAHADIREAIAANTSAIELLTNGASAEEIDSVNDLIQYVNEHGSEVTGMKADIKTNADAIAAITNGNSINDFTTVEEYFTEFETSVSEMLGEVPADKNIVQMIADMKTAYETDKKEINEAIDYKLELYSEYEDIALPSSQNWESVAYGNGKFVAVCNYKSDALAYSEDGINWTEMLSPSKSNQTIQYYNGKFIIYLLDAGDIYYSEDGINWVRSASPIPYRYKITYITYGENKFVGVSNQTGIAVYSEDGINWIETTLPYSYWWRSVAYGDGKFVAVGSIPGGGIDKAIYSEDGINWVETPMPSSQSWRSVVYGDGKFVSVAGMSGVAAYSEDGVNWIETTISRTGNWSQLIHGNGKFVTTSYNDCDKAIYSEDGINWVETPLPSSQSWRSIAYGDGKFVAIACDSDKEAYSEDGINWVGQKKVIILSQNNTDVTEDTANVIKPYLNLITDLTTEQLTELTTLLEGI